MAKRYPLPRLLLLTDARTDARLPRVLAQLPKGSGVVFRHYHLSPSERRARFAALRRVCRQRGLVAVLAASAPAARHWGAAGAYAAPDRFGRCTGGLRFATAHSLREIARAVAVRADAVLLSPVHATRSHPGGKVLGPVRFALLARQSPLPVIALGGMTRARAARLPGHGWAAIDGLCQTAG